MAKIHYRSILAIAGLSTLLGCSHQQADLAAIATGTGVHPSVIHSGPFPLKALEPQAGTYPILRIYIEGDGHAWATSSQPSLDPTPQTSIVARLSATDPQPSVYLARPCQFIHSVGCNQALWTRKRFSQEVIDSYGEALDQLKRKYNVDRFELVGYSGGAAVALLIASRRADIAGIQTIAGNLDTEAWLRTRHLAPMYGSLNPADYAARLTNVPQRHFIGVNDKTVPSEVVSSYLDKAGNRCAQIVKVSATHTEGYDEAWRRTSNTPYPCRADQ